MPTRKVPAPANDRSIFLLLLGVGEITPIPFPPQFQFHSQGHDTVLPWENWHWPFLPLCSLSQALPNLVVCPLEHEQVSF